MMKSLQLNVVTYNREVIEYIQNELSKGEALNDIIEKVLSIGIAVIERVQSSRDVEFVKKETEKMIISFNNRLSTLETNIQNNVENQIGKYFNPDLEDSYSKKFANYLRQHLSTFERNSKALLDQAKEITNDRFLSIENGIKDAEKNFNPELETSYFGKIKKIIIDVEKSINKQLDDKHSESFAFKLKTDTTSLFGENSPVLISVGKIIQDYTEEFSNQIDSLKKIITKEEGKQEGLLEMFEKSSLKGATFEEEVFSMLEYIAQPFDDVVEYIGNKPEIGCNNKKGDYKYILNEGMSLLVEAKDDSQGLKSCLDYLNNAMANRGCTFAIMVKKSDNQLPKQVGIFGFYNNNKIITSINYLEFAIRWARLFLTKTENKNVVGINQTLVLQKITDVLSKLKELSNVKSNITKMRNSVNTHADASNVILDSIKTEIETQLQEIELEVRSCKTLENNNSIAA